MKVCFMFEISINLFRILLYHLFSSYGFSGTLGLHFILSGLLGNGVTSQGSRRELNVLEQQMSKL